MSYAVRPSRAVVYAGAQYPGVGLVRFAPVVVRSLLLVGDRFSSLILPPLRAICHDNKCVLHTYCADDWPAKLGQLATKLNPDATIVIMPEGTCSESTAGRDANSRVVLQVCGVNMSAAGLAAAAASAWHNVQAQIQQSKPRPRV